MSARAWRTVSPASLTTIRTALALFAHGGIKPYEVIATGAANPKFLQWFAFEAAVRNRVHRSLSFRD
jgi:hypothetical protein